MTPLLLPSLPPTLQPLLHLLLPVPPPLLRELSRQHHLLAPSPATEHGSCSEPRRRGRWAVRGLREEEAQRRCGVVLRWRTRRRHGGASGADSRRGDGTGVRAVCPGGGGRRGVQYSIRFGVRIDTIRSELFGGFGRSCFCLSGLCPNHRPNKDR
jgi:hypothetical protein